MKSILLVFSVITNFVDLLSANVSTRAPQVLDIEPHDDSMIKIAFGSCYGKPGKTSTIFETIGNDGPDVWIWLGDATYIDYDPITEYMSEIDSSTADHARERFKETTEAPGYKDLKQRAKIIGVWDDHDMGKNDGGTTFEHKDRNRDIYLDFIDEPSDSERRL